MFHCRSPQAPPYAKKSVKRKVTEKRETRRVQIDIENHILP